MALDSTLMVFGGEGVCRQEGQRSVERGWPVCCVMGARSDVFHVGWWEAEGKNEVKGKRRQEVRGCSRWGRRGWRPQAVLSFHGSSAMGEWTTTGFFKWLGCLLKCLFVLKKWARFWVERTLRKKYLNSATGPERWKNGRRGGKGKMLALLDFFF